MKAMLVKTDKGLRGATPADQEAWAKFRRKLETMKPGTWLRMEWARPRHGKHHRKFFALLQLVAENSETYDTVAIRKMDELDALNTTIRRLTEAWEP